MTTVIDIHGKPLDFGTPDGKPPTGGHCCRGFTLFWTFNDLAAAYDAATAGKITFVRPATGKEVDLPDDILTIGPLVRLVGVCSANPLTGEVFRDPRKVWRCAHQLIDYTCAIYDRRPEMCRRYPSSRHGSRCRFLHCQSVDCPAYGTKGNS